MDSDPDVNYTALLGVIAAASFLAPLVTDAGVSLGLSDTLFAPVSLIVAASIIIAWLAATGRDRSA